MSVTISATPGRMDRVRETALGGISVPKFLAVSLQLGLLLLVLRQFQIENAAFLRLAMLAFGGFTLHAWLPLRYRLPFFVLLSLTAILMVMGLQHGLWLIGIGLVLILICHLPLPFALRAALLLVVGMVLGLQRANLLVFPWSAAIWPILGSMFMFRLIVYMYDLRHEQVPFSLSRSLAYFFMLPNACFPLFPVIDYKTFRRNYFDAEAFRIYQTGIDWILRGVIQLIIYRFVYYYLTLAPAEVHDTPQLVQYFLANFLLYLRVSGLFHLIVGMLHLFGFRLPETHHRFFLASSFTDFWRRINIYWKDFMLKVFYYPIYFELKRFGATTALVLSTLLVFLLTWFLHAYQWFWLRGTILFVWQDILFWAILGVLVVVNSLYEAKLGRVRTLGKAGKSWRSQAVLAAKTFATFCVICVLWSFWTSESVSAWVSLWHESNPVGIPGVQAADSIFQLPSLLVLGLLLALGSSLGSVGAISDAPMRPAVEKPSLVPVMVTTGKLVLLFLLGFEAVYSQFNPSTATMVLSLRSGKLSRLDTAKLERGYYENLLDVNRFNSQLWEVYSKKPKNWIDVDNAGLKRFTGGFAQNELIPSFVSNSQYGTISINEHGMRDKNYPLSPEPGVFRIAVLGASSVMGWGVGDGETFEALVEDRLNREHLGTSSTRYELLNFGVPGYQPPQQLWALNKALSFNPASVFYVATGREMSRSANYLAEVVRKKIDIPYPALRDIVAHAGLHAGMDETDALRLLAPFQAEILNAVYRQIVAECRQRRILPVLVFLPQVREGAWQEETPQTLSIAESAGFLVLDLSKIYRKEDITSIRLAEWDEHPNKKGHQLIATRLFEAMSAEQAKLFSTVDP